ncbi:MAG: hypothetical protein QG623_428 [Patescibacteria group bacterium]|nr:hypothetical protein [Patescibacteria group bacterium]
MVLDMYKPYSADKAAILFKGTPAQATQQLLTLEGGSGTDRLKAGRYCIQRARENPNTNCGKSWLERGETDLMRALSLETKLVHGFSASAGKAMFELANLPIYREIVNGSQTPSIEAMTEVYENGLDIGETFCQWIDYFLGNKGFSANVDMGESAQGLIGCSSEVAVLALLQRYAISGVGDGSWFAIPSMYEEDYHINDQGDGSVNWDIGVYTQLEEGETSTLSYKLQVKTLANLGITPPREEDGIVLVRLNPDLALPSDSGRIAPYIIRECASEFAEGGYSIGATERINQRTDLLLDILG